MCKQKVLTDGMLSFKEFCVDQDKGADSNYILSTKLKTENTQVLLLQYWELIH